ncbi:c-type cytochrome [Solimonas marina]|uniref:C-type cytochrome n=1 Tax=Solimonas marina TaxID=2714601 RepID=A0A970B6U9_9GAMM|nr:c-type cytochrome [Solimonas marina]NKF22985.1 c-type cytochrome [Solimonas marina]
MTRNKFLTIISATVFLLATPLLAMAAEAVPDGAKVYDQACAKCHTSAFGAFFSGAPKTGKQQTWDRLLQQAGSVDALIANANQGIGKMPAKGGANDLSDEDVAAAVHYMLSKSGH